MLAGYEPPSAYLHVARLPVGLPVGVALCGALEHVRGRRDLGLGGLQDRVGAGAGPGRERRAEVAVAGSSDGILWLCRSASCPANAWCRAARSLIHWLSVIRNRGLSPDASPSEVSRSTLRVPVQKAGPSQPSAGQDRMFCAREKIRMAQDIGIREAAIRWAANTGCLRAPLRHGPWDARPDNRDDVASGDLIRTNGKLVVCDA